MTRSDRPLSSEGYPIPLTRAELVSGGFLGTLDDAAWYSIPSARRPERVEAMEGALREQGYAAEARIVDGQGRLVIMARANGTLRASRYALESPDGITPPPPGVPRDPKDIAGQGATSN